MGGIELVTLIVRRDAENDYMEFLRQAGMATVFGLPCNGTASRSLLDRLGLETAEKTLILTAMLREKTDSLMKGLVSQLGLEVPGSGVAFTVPLDAVGGQSSLQVLMEGQSYSLEEVRNVEKMEQYPWALIVAIAEAGSTDMVMDAARGAGARGGTVVHARGTAGEMAKKFLGVSLATEKEIIMILVSREQRDAVMRAVMDQAGIRSEAHTVLFTLPVDNVEGLRSIREQARE